MALAAAGLTSCEPDDDPQIQEPTEFILNTPPFAGQLYQLQRGHTMEFTCSQPNYGLTLAPTYTLEVSLYNDFGASQPAPAEGEEAAPYSVLISPVDPVSAVMVVEDKTLSDAILSMRGISEEKDYTPAVNTVYVRAIASLNGQAEIVSTNPAVVLEQVADYFSLEADMPLIYTPGNSNGWNQANSMPLSGYEQDEATGEWTKYRGLVYLNGEFKFDTTLDWSLNYGDDGNDGKLDQNGANIPLPETGEGLYFIDLNIKALTYTLTYISSFGITGDLNGWTTDAPAEMEHSDDYKIWTWEGDMADGGFKFILNGPTTQWTLNYGGPADGLTFNGPNISSTAGQHKVTVNLSTVPYTATVE